MSSPRSASVWSVDPDLAQGNRLALPFGRQEPQGSRAGQHGSRRAVLDVALDHLHHGGGCFGHGADHRRHDVADTGLQDIHADGSTRLIVQAELGCVFVVDRKDEPDGLPLAGRHIAYHRRKEDRSGHPVDQRFVRRRGTQAVVVRQRDAGQALLHQPDNAVGIAVGQALQQIHEVRILGGGVITGFEIAILGQLQQRPQECRGNHLINMPVRIHHLIAQGVVQGVPKAQGGHEDRGAERKADHDEG